MDADLRQAIDLLRQHNRLIAFHNNADPDHKVLVLTIDGRGISYDELDRLVKALDENKALHCWNYKLIVEIESINPK